MGHRSAPRRQPQQMYRLQCAQISGSSAVENSAPQFSLSAPGLPKNDDLGE